MPGNDHRFGCMLNKCFVFLSLGLTVKVKPPSRSTYVGHTYIAPRTYCTLLVMLLLEFSIMRDEQGLWKQMSKSGRKEVKWGAWFSVTAR